MFFLEEVPNVYNFIICISSYFDSVVPQNLEKNPFALQRALYYWKPIVECIAFVTVVVQIIPVVFGCYIWYFQDGTYDGDIGQTTMIQSISALLPFLASIALMKISMDFIRKDLNMLFGANPNSGHIHHHPLV